MLHGFGNDAIVYGHMYQLGEESIEKHEKIAQQKKHNNTNIAKEENKH
jgi:UDP-N-acetylmuramyl pentapeptide synthase